MPKFRTLVLATYPQTLAWRAVERRVADRLFRVPHGLTARRLDDLRGVADFLELRAKLD